MFSWRFIHRMIVHPIANPPMAAIVGSSGLSQNRPFGGSPKERTRSFERFHNAQTLHRTAIYACLHWGGFGGVNVGIYGMECLGWGFTRLYKLAI